MSVPQSSVNLFATPQGSAFTPTGTYPYNQLRIQPPHSLSPDSYVPVTQQNNTTQQLTSGQAAKSFVKGLLSPVSILFQSPTGLLLGMGSFAAHGVFLGATNGAAAPFMLAFGLGLGIFQFSRGLYRVIHQKSTPPQKQQANRRKAFYEFGAGITAFALCGIGAKKSLTEFFVSKKGGLKPHIEREIAQMSIGKATLKNLRLLPESLIGTGKSFARPTKAVSNISNFFERQATDSVKVIKGIGSSSTTWWGGALEFLQSLSAIRNFSSILSILHFIH